MPIPRDTTVDDLGEMVRLDPPCAGWRFARSPNTPTRERSTYSVRRLPALTSFAVAPPWKPSGGALTVVMRSREFTPCWVIRRSSSSGPQSRHVPAYVIRNRTTQYGSSCRVGGQPRATRRFKRSRSLWRDDDLDAVLASMTDDPNDVVRKQAAWVLSHHAPVGSRLIQRWRVSALSRDRVWVCDFLAQSSIPDRSAILETLLHDPDGHVRKAARRALTTLDGTTTRSRSDKNSACGPASVGRFSGARS